jgi:hypothetical protein
MTETITIPAAAAVPRRVRSPAAAWAGGLVALLGTVLVVAAGAILVAFGEDSTLSSDPHSLSTSTAALVSGTASIDDTADIASALGSPRIRIAAESDGDRGVFVGIGRAADVDRYLAGAPVAEVTDLKLAPFRLERSVRRGTAVPVAPAGQDFWLARSSGDSRAGIDWKVRDGDYRAVIMNADGSRDVATHGTFGVKVPHVSPIALGLLIAGIVMAAAGLTAFVTGVRRPR